MTLSWPGAVATFQVTFAEVFIAVTVIIAALYRLGWRSVLLGALLGGTAFAALTMGLQRTTYALALRWLEWVSAALLFAFGLYLTSMFIDGLARREQTGASLRFGSHWQRPLNWLGVGIAAWAIVAEGLEILIVWLGLALEEGFATASLGAGLAIGITGGLAVALGLTGIFRQLPGWFLDGIAASLVISYGSYFLALAVAHIGT